VYAQVKRLLDWQAPPLITQDLRMSPINRNVVGELNKKVIMDQGPWVDGESTMAWERLVKRGFITNVKGTFFGMSESEEASKRR